MEKFFRYGFRAQNIPYYDCSLVNRSHDEWKSMGQSNVPFGIACIVYAFIIQGLYFLIMVAMWKRRKNNTCYQIMFILGLYDCLNLVINSELTGYFLLVGMNYCTSPDLNYIAGAAAVGVWCGACYCCLMLVINRLLDLWDPDLTRKVFGGTKMLLWMFGLIAYTSYFILFTPPVLFNSLFQSWFFDPFIRGTEEEMGMFYNIPHTINNCGVVLLTALLYVLLILILGYKYGLEGMGNISSVRRSIMIQCIVICSLNLIGSFLYVYMQFFFVPEWLIITGHFCWQIINGMPVAVYLIMNGTLRGDVRKMLAGGRLSTILSNFSHSGPRVPPEPVATTSFFTTDASMYTARVHPEGCQHLNSS